MSISKIVAYESMDVIILRRRLAAADCGHKAKQMKLEMDTPIATFTTTWPRTKNPPSTTILVKEVTFQLEEILNRMTYTINIMMLVMLAAVPKLGLSNRIFVHEIAIMAAAIQDKIMRSPNQSILGTLASIKLPSADAHVTTAESATPIKQKTSASNIAPAVLAGLKYTDL